MRPYLSRSTWPAIASLFIASLLGFTATALASRAATVCSKYASASGSDTNPGTRRAPLRTAQKLVDSLTAGQTGCLTGGGPFVGDVAFHRHGDGPRSRITLTSDPRSSRATIDGAVYVPPTSPYVTINNVRVDRTDSQQVVAVQLFGDYGRLTNSDVYGANRPGIGVQIGYQRTAMDVEVAGNRIHNFGSHAIDAHGLYVDLSNGAQVHNNIIYDNAGGYGIHLWTHSMNGHFFDNTIDRNGAGSIMIAGQTNVNGGPSSDNEIDHNVLSNPISGRNVVIFWSNYPVNRPGRGNYVHDNIYWNGSLDQGFAYCRSSCSGVRYRHNRKANPESLIRKLRA